MASLIIERDDGSKLCLRAGHGERLIDVLVRQARLGTFTLPWRCVRGTCGACAVRIEGECQPATQAELRVLRRHHPEPEALRLACHVRCTHTLHVHLPAIPD